MIIYHSGNEKGLRVGDVRDLGWSVMLVSSNSTAEALGEQDSDKSIDADDPECRER